MWLLDRLAVTYSILPPVAQKARSTGNATEGELPTEEASNAKTTNQGESPTRNQKPILTIYEDFIAFSWPKSWEALVTSQVLIPMVDSGLNIRDHKAVWHGCMKAVSLYLF